MLARIGRGGAVVSVQVNHVQWRVLKRQTGAGSVAASRRYPDPPSGVRPSRALHPTVPPTMDRRHGSGLAARRIIAAGAALPAVSPGRRAHRGVPTDSLDDDADLRAGDGGRHRVAGTDPLRAGSLEDHGPAKDVGAGVGRGELVVGRKLGRGI